MRQLLALSFALLLAAGAGRAAAAGVDVKGAWIRTPPNGASTAAAYATLVNRALSSDRLIGARSADAADVTVHQSAMSGGMMRMRATPALPIAGSGTVRLRPGGYHLMMMGLRRPLRLGDSVRIVLLFQRAGDVSATFAVRDTAP